MDGHMWLEGGVFLLSIPNVCWVAIAGERQMTWKIATVIPGIVHEKWLLEKKAPFPVVRTGRALCDCASLQGCAVPCE